MKHHFAKLWMGISLALACALAVQVEATTLVRMDLPQMARASGAIVRARCVSNTTAWDAGEIWTFTTFDVEESWRGSLPNRITVRLLGGTVSTITSHVSGIPRFQPGEEVVLFLEPTQRGDFSVVSWQQGTFRIAHDRGSNAAGTAEVVTQDTASSEVFDASTHRFVTSGIRNMPLDTFRAQILAALANTGSNINASGQNP